MKRQISAIRAFFGAALLGSACLTACLTRGPLIFPYDPVLDSGLQEYKIRLNVMVTDAGDQAGTPLGTFEAYRSRYLDLETRLDLMLERSKHDEANDLGCKFDPAFLKRVGPQFAAVAAELAKTEAIQDDSKGCMSRLLANVRAQLGEVKKIQSIPALCAWPEQPTLTCIRPAVVKNALSASNQSIDAALLIQSAKRKGEIQ